MSGQVAERAQQALHLQDRKLTCQHIFELSAAQLMCLLPGADTQLHAPSAALQLRLMISARGIA